MRDPRVDPKVGDVVCCCYKNGGYEGPAVEVLAVIGAVIGLADGLFGVRWIQRSSWCEVSPLVTEWKVLHRAD